MHINPYPTEVGGRFLGGQQAGWLSSLFDVGGMVGVVGVGWITDLMGRRTLVMTVMEYLTIPLVSSCDVRMGCVRVWVVVEVC